MVPQKPGKSPGPEPKVVDRPARVVAAAASCSNTCSVRLKANAGSALTVKPADFDYKLRNLVHCPALQTFLVTYSAALILKSVSISIQDQPLSDVMLRLKIQHRNMSYEKLQESAINVMIFKMQMRSKLENSRR